MAYRVFGETPQELPVEQRRNFHLVTASFTPEAAQREAARCLQCSTLCNVCVTVCPNRANIGFQVPKVNYRLQQIHVQGENYSLQEREHFQVEQPYQVLNIVDWCNECGNCRTFCPTAGAPYKDKERICLSLPCFQDTPAAFYLTVENGQPQVQTSRRGKIETLSLAKEYFRYETEMIAVKLDTSSFHVQDVAVKKSFPGTVDLRLAAEMGI